MKQRWQDGHPLLASLVQQLPGSLLVVGSIGASYLMVDTAGERDLSDLELMLFQAMALGLGLAGSFWIGRRSARVAAEEIVRPHARSAFRRLLSLYQAVGRLGRSIEVRRTVLRSTALDREGASVPLADVEAALDLLATQVIEQLGTANDAMDDWRDLVPREVEEVEDRARLTSREDSSEESDPTTGEAGDV